MLALGTGDSIPQLRPVSCGVRGLAGSGSGGPLCRWRSLGVLRQGIGDLEAAHGDESEAALEVDARQKTWVKKRAAGSLKNATRSSPRVLRTPAAAVIRFDAWAAARALAATRAVAAVAAEELAMSVGSTRDRTDAVAIAEFRLFHEVTRVRILGGSPSVMHR